MKINQGVIQEKETLIPGQYASLEGWELYDYQIAVGEIIWSYKQIRPEEQFIEMSGYGLWRKRLFKAMIKNDGSIFILQPGSNIRDKIHPLDQSHGFPLKPRS